MMTTYSAHVCESPPELMVRYLEEAGLTHLYAVALYHSPSVIGGALPREQARQRTYLGHAGLTHRGVGARRGWRAEALCVTKQRAQV